MLTVALIYLQVQELLVVAVVAAFVVVGKRVGCTFGYHRNLELPVGPVPVAGARQI